jgi:diguanylate cyclase (GGDEF)-like protein
VRKPLSNLLGLGSYRGRYLYLAATALLLLLFFAYASWNRIHESHKLTRANIEMRKLAEQDLHSILDQNQRLRTNIYKFSLDPAPSKQKHLQLSMIRLNEQINAIDGKRLNNDRDLTGLIALRDFPERLRIAVQQLVAVRTSPEHWIPATEIMTRDMAPTNEVVLATLATMLADEDIQNDSHALIVLLEIKNRWLSTVSEFRLIAANKLGLFDEAEKGMQGRRHDLGLVAAQLSSDLETLEQLLRQHDHDFVLDTAYAQLRSEIERWMSIQGKVMNLLQLEDWRMDMPALRAIETILKQLQDQVLSLEASLAIQSSEDISHLNRLNSQQSFYFIFVFLIALLIALISYFLFDRNILRPIARATRAMLLQSKGLSQELEIEVRTSETREMLEAFNLMSERIKQRKQRLDFIAHHDALTKLPNRLMFNERLEHAIRLTGRGQHTLALFMIDLDRFKLVNDTLGHLIGDQLLQETANRLRACLRAEDTVARLGGDEFAVIIENFRSVSEIDRLAEKLIQIIARDFSIEGHIINVSASIGIALAPEHASDPVTLLRYADIALYESKGRGRNCFVHFNPVMAVQEERGDYSLRIHG